MQVNQEILSNEFIDSYKQTPVPWGYNGLGYVVFKRTYARLHPDGKSTEEWYETVGRCINGAQKIGAGYTKKEAEQLYDLIFNLKCCFAGRMLWQLGTGCVEKFGANSLLNCWFTKIAKPTDFSFLFENLMLGGGVGFSIRREDVYEFPRVLRNVKIVIKNTKDADFIVPDSREGWISVFDRVLDSYFNTGKSFSYSTILIRNAGEPIKGFGGTSSGPRILEEGLQKICTVLKLREGKKIRSIDALDICNIIGSIVVAGNIRRSAQIALGDPDDMLFLKAKRWDLGSIPNWRAMSNNTIYADDYDHIMENVWDGYAGNGEPYGFFNLTLAQSYGRLKDKIKDNCAGLNPCQPKEAYVLTRNGLITFGELKEGTEIWSSEGFTKVIKKWSNGVKPVFKYRTSAGYFLGTANHQILENQVKTPVSEAVGIDSLVGNYNSNLVTNPQDVMDGLVIGDGSVHKASNNLVHLLVGENDQSYFDSEIKHLILKYRPGLTDEAYEVSTTITADDMALTFNRAIPDRFLKNPTKLVGFLRGLYTANGSVVSNRITFKTASPTMRDQVQLALSSLGIKSYYTTNKSHDVEFNNGTYTCKESYDVNITADRNKFVSIIGFLQPYKNEKIQLKDSSRKGNATYDIIHTESIGEEEVFDITVDNTTHTYWTAGVNVSNCGEITLEDKECCNLSELFLNNIKTKSELIECAKLLYKTQKAISNLHFIHPETEKLVHKNNRIGLGVGGICQAIDKLEWLDDCYSELKAFDKQWSKERGWNECIKLTTVKPSGTISLLAGATPGVHPSIFPYYWRTIRMAVTDTLVEYCKKLGYRSEFSINYDGSLDRNICVVYFPCKTTEKTLVAKDTPAVQQLELIKRLQTIWSDNAVSCTVYYHKEELPAIKVWLNSNYRSSIKSVSFLLHKDHNFAQAPYIEISEEEYKEAVKHSKAISVYSNGGEQELLDNLECSSGSCPIK